MNVRTLIHTSSQTFDSSPDQTDDLSFFKVFEYGARWMYYQLNDTSTFAEFDDRQNFTFYGVIKYMVSLFVFVLFSVLFYVIHPFLLPLSILVFYFVEVHFLFLFPLVLDHEEAPFLKSLKATYKVGVLNATWTVLQIGLFMLWGFLNFKKPLRNWYIGCLAIIVWYKHEVRGRI